MVQILRLLAILAVLAVLAGCGNKGELVKPSPKTTSASMQPS